MGSSRETSDRTTPQLERADNWGPSVRGLGLLLLVGGLVWAAVGTIGMDRGTQIFAGCAVAGLGLLVAILGQILHTVETRR